MSHNDKQYPDNSALYDRMATNRAVAAKRPVSEKLAVAQKLRDFERSLATTRQANKALRKAKQVKISIKTR